jgi:uncharacterized protein
MNIWAIGDLHLSFSTPNKQMDIFGTHWKNHAQKIKENWIKKIKKNDLILIPGDISWAMNLTEALVDLNWIDSLPGKKIILKGNHDYWWPSLKKLNENLPPSIEALQNNAININNVSIGGARLWDSKEYSFNNYIETIPNTKSKEKQEIDSEKIFLRDLQKLQNSLSQMDKTAQIKIVMTHFPPIGADLKDSEVSKLLDTFNIDICIFAHLHSVKKENLYFGKKNNTKYFLVSADYINFDPVKLI